jgi:hypothetical protein
LPSRQTVAANGRFIVFYSSISAAGLHGRNSVPVEIRGWAFCGQVDRMPQADLNEVACGHGYVCYSRGAWPFIHPLGEITCISLIAKNIDSSSIAPPLARHFLQVAPIESAAAEIFLLCRFNAPRHSR